MKFGVVGYGSIGKRHAKNLRTLGHQVVVYDPAYSGSDVSRETGIYDDPSIAGVVIATPSPYHEGPLRACIERGKHVLIEKPISTSIGMLPQLLDAAKEKGRVVMVGNNLRFHPSVLRAKTWLGVNALGEPRWANFICATENTATAMRDGVILNTGGHEVDIALHLFGRADVLTATTSADINVDFVLEHASGVRSTFHLDIDTPDRVRQFWIGGATKSVQFDLDLRTVYSHQDNGTYLGGSYDHDYLSEVNAFVYRIKGMETMPGATGEEGLETLRVLLDVRKKAGLP